MKKLKYDKYAVTGALGFIGSHLVEEIVKQGKQVLCIDNLSNGGFHNVKPFWDSDLCTFIAANLGYQPNLADHLKDVDVVFHLACSKCTYCRENPDLDLMTNALGSLHLFQAAQEIGVKKIVHASTGSVNRGKPKSFYGVSKQAGENYLRAMREYHPDFRFTSIRYHHVYGPRQDHGPQGGVVAIFIKKMLDGLTVSIHGDGRQQRHFTYVKDVVDFTFRCEEEYDCQFVDLAEWGPTTISELYAILCKLIGSDHGLVMTKARPGDIMYFDISESQMVPTTDWRDRLVANLKETIESYRV